MHRACLVLAAVGALELSASALPEERLIDTERSTITVRVFKAGSSSGPSGEYAIQAPILEGSFEPSVPHIQLVIDARRMHVVNSGLSTRERQEVESRMFGPDVLNVDRFPWISFHSVEIKKGDGSKWLLYSEMGLRGQVRSMTVSVLPGQDRYTGSTAIRQSDFGMTPVTAAGGLVKVNDEIIIDFDIVIAKP